MGCGASSKPKVVSVVVNGKKVHKYVASPKSKDTGTDSKDFAMGQDPSDSEGVGPRKPSKDSVGPRKGSKDAVEPRRGSKQSTNGVWHCNNCKDCDLALVKTIEEAYPVDDNDRKSVSRSNRKHHGGSYSDVTVAKMGPKQINCSTCGVFVLGRYEEAAFYYCKRCRGNGHRFELCVSCYDRTVSSTIGNEKKTMLYNGLMKPEPYSYKLKPMLGVSPKPSPLPSPKGSPRPLLDDEASPRPSPQASPKRSPRPLLDEDASPTRHNDILDCLLTPASSRACSKSPRPSPRGPRSKTMPAQLALPGSPMGSQSPRPSPRRKTMPATLDPAGKLMPGPSTGDVADTSSSGSTRASTNSSESRMGSRQSARGCLLPPEAVNAGRRKSL